VAVFIQGKAATGTGVTSIAVAFTSAVTSGNHLVAAIQTPNTTGITVADNVNAGNYSVSDNHSTTNNANDNALWYKENTGAGTPTVTFSSIPAGNVGVCIGEYNGPLTSASLDVHGATDATGTTITSGSKTSTGANGDLLVSFTSQTTQNVTLSNSTSGWTVDVNNSPNATMDAALASRVQSTSGAFTTTWGVSGSSQDLSVLVAAFKLQAVASSTPGQVSYAYGSN